MKDEKTRNTAVTLPLSVIRRGVRKAKQLHGNRGFSRYVTNLITADLAKK